MCRCYLQQVVFTVCGIESNNTLLVPTENTKNWSLLVTHIAQAVAPGDSCYMATSLESVEEHVKGREKVYFSGAREGLVASSN